ncbi:MULTISPECIES: helix-turn-helix domain-containing protein [Pseudofrankia]|uniref:helix-turn-helix domain-containing protein n=1 Tax=Pseudofrankia TaxID=2994363 RepID=UPI000234D8CC|nr:hypothetical protein BCD49_23295 [Pseudofrankia sp. EUN1h]
MTPAPAGVAVRELAADVPGGEDWAAVAAELNKRMAARRMSQQRLAEVSGISVATIRLLQRGAGGRRARTDTLAALSRALDWPGDQLLKVLLSEQPAAETAVSGVESEGCLFGVVSFADPGRTRALAVHLPFESPAAARAYALRRGLAHSLVSPLAFDTTVNLAIDGGDGRADATEAAVGMVVARAG